MQTLFSASNLIAFINCRSVDETLRLVQAFQYTDTHGEVCPAGWKPGKKAMKPDVIGSKEYFKDQ